VPHPYFSRLVRGGDSAPLAPPRPLSNLWKTAQIDAAVQNAESLSTTPRSAVRRSRAAEPAPSQNPSEVEGRSATHLGPVKPLQRSSNTRASQTSLSGETQLSPLAVPTRQDETSQRGHAQAGPSRHTQKPAIAATVPTGPTSAVPSVEAKNIPAETRPMLVSESAHADGANLASRAFPASIGGPPAHPQPMESATPGPGESSRRTRQSSTPEEPREKTNTVQIGKIEVQVIPTPASSYRKTPPPAQPRARLARGYALWPGF